jgi:hypothetical protein
MKFNPYPKVSSKFIAAGFARQGVTGGLEVLFCAKEPAKPRKEQTSL